MCFDCPQSERKDLYFRFHVEVPPKNWFSQSHRFIFVKNGSEYVSFTLHSIEQARERLREFENGSWSVKFEGALWTGEGSNLTNQNNRLVMRMLEDSIRNHEVGREVSVNHQLSRR